MPAILVGKTFWKIIPTSHKAICTKVHPLIVMKRHGRRYGPVKSELNEAY